MMVLDVDEEMSGVCGGDDGDNGGGDSSYGSRGASEGGEMVMMVVVIEMVLIVGMEVNKYSGDLSIMTETVLVVWCI